MLPHDAVHHVRVDEGTVGGDPHEDVGPELLGSPHQPGEHHPGAEPPERDHRHDGRGLRAFECACGGIVLVDEERGQTDEQDGLGDELPAEEHSGGGGERGAHGGVVPAGHRSVTSSFDR